MLYQLTSRAAGCAAWLDSELQPCEPQVGLQYTMAASGWLGLGAVVRAWLGYFTSTDRHAAVIEGSPECEGHSYRVMLLVLVVAAIPAVLAKGASAATVSGVTVGRCAQYVMCVCNALV